SEIPRKVLEMILGQGPKNVDAFAPQVALSAMLAAGTPQVNQALIDMHEDWSKEEKAGPALAEVAQTVDSILDSMGGVAGTSEIVTELRERSGADLSSAKRDAALRRRTEGLVRIVVDGRRHRRRGGDDLLKPLEERRRGDRVIALGRDGDLLDLALHLQDRVSEAVASLDDVLSPARSREVVAPLLDEVEPDSPLVAGHRALRLGAALASNVAAVSSAGELHRRALRAPDALRIALGDLSTDARMSPKVLQDRVAARFPQLTLLPGRPHLHPRGSGCCQAPLGWTAWPPRPASLCGSPTTWMSTWGRRSTVTPPCSPSARPRRPALIAASWRTHRPRGAWRIPAAGAPTSCSAP